MSILTTPRLGLTKDDGIELYSVARVNANTQKIDDNIGAIVCTSSTRPSVPYQGMNIYETDTGFHGIWRSDLSAWVIPRAGLYASAVRPTVGLYEGYTFYRSDKDWHEVWDGAAWRVVGTHNVSALADVTNPKTNQTMIQSSDSWEYRWNGSAWNAVRPLGSAPGIERRLEAATAIPAATNTKVPFDTVIAGAVDITHSAGEFTFSRSGRYEFTSSIRSNVLTEMYLWFAKTGASTGNRGKTANSAVLNVAASATVRVNAGEVWSVYMWSQLATNLVREAPANPDDYAPYFSAAYLGPL